MTNLCKSQLTSEKRGNPAIDSVDALTAYDSVNRLYHSDFILEVKNVSVVNEGCGLQRLMLTKAKSPT